MQEAANDTTYTTYITCIMFVGFSSFGTYGHHVLNYLLLFTIPLFTSILTYIS